MDFNLYTSLPVVNKLSFSGGSKEKNGYIVLTKEKNTFEFHITVSGMEDLSINNYLRLFFDLIFKPLDTPIQDPMFSEEDISQFYEKDFVCTKVVEITEHVNSTQNFTLEFSIDQEYFDKFMYLRNKNKAILDIFYIEGRYTHKHDGEMGIAASLEAGKFLEINIPVTLEI